MLPFPGTLRVCYDRQHCIVRSVCGIVGQIFAWSHSHFIYRTRFAKAARVDDFNSRDIYSPERERTLVLLSAFINFIKFTEQYCDVFLKDLRDRSDTLIVRRQEVTARLNIEGLYLNLNCSSIYHPFIVCHGVFDRGTQELRRILEAIFSVGRLSLDSDPYI